MLSKTAEIKKNPTLIQKTNRVLKIHSNRQNCSHITSGHVGYTGTRIISSNVCVNGESGKVVKQNVKNANSQNRVELNAATRVSARFERNASLGVSDICSQKIKDGDGVCLGDGYRVSTLATSSPVSTYNRYEILQQDDAVVSCHSDSTWAETPSDLKLINNQDLRSSKKTANKPDSHNASLSDTSVKNNVCTPLKVGVAGQNNKTTCTDFDTQSAKGQRSKLGFYVPFNSQGHIGTGPQNCHLWDSNPQR